MTTNQTVFILSEYDELLVLDADDPKSTTLFNSSVYSSLEAAQQAVKDSLDDGFQDIAIEWTHDVWTKGWVKNSWAAYVEEVDKHYLIREAEVLS